MDTANPHLGTTSEYTVSENDPTTTKTKKRGKKRTVDPPDDSNDNMDNGDISKSSTKQNLDSKTKRSTDQELNHHSEIPMKPYFKHNNQTNQLITETLDPLRGWFARCASRPTPQTHPRQRQIAGGISAGKPALQLYRSAR